MVIRRSRFRAAGPLILFGFLFLSSGQLRADGDVSLDFILQNIILRTREIEYTIPGTPIVKKTKVATVVFPDRENMVCESESAAREALAKLRSENRDERNRDAFRFYVADGFARAAKSLERVANEHKGSFDDLEFAELTSKIEDLRLLADVIDSTIDHGALARLEPGDLDCDKVTDNDVERR